MSELTQITNSGAEHSTFSNWQNLSWHAPQLVQNKLWFFSQRIMAALALLVLAPLFLCLWIGVKISSKGPFIYAQKRPGLYGAPFTALKVRTMRTGADQDLARARRVDRNDPMITPIGKALRDLKLDELPQLVNVVRGEMALVGPRPIAPTLQEELASQIPGFNRRLNVRPGLTSLAQVCLYDNADADNLVNDWSIRFEAELDYIYNRSAGYDIVIIAMTVAFIVKKILRKLPRKIVTFFLVASLLMLTACGERLATRKFVKADTALEKDIRAYGDRTDPAIIQIEPISIPADPGAEQDPVYRVGAGDKISINVFGEDGLDNLEVAVDGAGFIQVPILERIHVAGATVSEIQATLKQGFSRQFRKPWIVVQVTEHRSRPVYLLGQFNNPGVIYMDGPTNLLQVLGLGRGLAETAHLSGARLWRNGAIAAVDMQALLMDGKAEHNVLLQAGDTLFVPSNTDKKAYVLGAVTRAGAVPFSNEPMTLLKALTQVGGPVKASALLSQVRVIRVRSATEGQLILVNAKDILKGKAPDLQLMPDDIVYVPDNWIENWNQVIRAVTPTLQLAGGALQPFVQVKFLKGD